jgi:DNA-binding IscR family transcriptional regulator
MENIKITQKSKEIKTVLYSEREAAVYLNVSPETLRKNLRYRGFISYIRGANGGISYLKADLLAYLRKHRVMAIK